ncbi:tectonic-2 isoform X2 [Melanotaenia boesemani]|uniref:tectonic-2 isoform X2 n=1 Tax=Melanotaenia boesemani TaxID=1250792 RepID=UPI001C03B37C|nr:tectonic-2 isoform X2 [Melanotaenia boesemani]
MANVGVNLISASISRQVTYVLLFISLVHAQDIVVFQPSFLTATGPTVTAFLLGNTSDVSLNLRTVSPSNTTGSVGSPSCVPEVTRWMLTKEQVEKTAVRVQLTRNQSLHACSDNDTNTDCCTKLLCVLETLQVTACVGNTPKASLLIQATIHARLFPAWTGYDNKTVIPNQVYQPLGPCPCDLTVRSCDIRCCCDKDCSSEDLKLFASYCLPGPFGGQVSPDPDYQCSVQSSKNSPDWFPFLCVTSPPENNPYLGFFYHGSTISPKSGPSFQRQTLSAPMPVNLYVQGRPIVTLNNQYFSIPQKVLGQCVNSAPVAFLKNFEVECVTLLHSCPTGFPLQTLPADLSVQVMNGQGGDVVVNVTDDIATDLNPFISEISAVSSTAHRLVCENVTLALDYKFFWQGNSITAITLTRTIGTLISDVSAALTTRYSAVFLNGNFIAEPNSGNPGYQVGKPVIAGIMDNNSESMQRTSISIWKPVHDGLCSTAEKKVVLFGENSTSGCLLPVGQQIPTQCNLLREVVTNLQADLITSTYVAKRGNPDLLTLTDWMNISFVTLNSSTTVNDTASTCSGIPSHQDILVWSLITGLVEGVPQREIRDLQVSYSLSTWTWDCGGKSLCEEIQLFPITSSVTFIDIPVNAEPPKTSFQINFTEYDCSRNDVCWPELAFPITRYYTGEPYSQSLAKGMILVFFFIAASILGTPWRQIRQVWYSTAL